MLSELIGRYQLRYAKLTPQIKFYSIKGIQRGLPIHMNPRLIAINGTLKGSTFPLNADQVSIGRESASSIPLTPSRLWYTPIRSKSAVYLCYF